MKSTVESKLRLALEKDKLPIVYQPIVDVISGETVIVAASLDWRNDDMGAVSMEYLVKVANDTGLTVPIGDWVIKTVCGQIRVWRETHIADMCVTAHVTACQLQTDPKFSEKVIDALMANRLPVDALQLEFPEAVLTHESPAITKNLTELEQHGVRMIIEDFGAGDTGISRLMRYPLDSVKIGRGYWDTGNDGERVSKIGNAIMTLANNLGISVVAQGVNTSEDLENIHGTNCRYAQGDYFARALPASEFEILLRHTGGKTLARSSLELVVPNVASSR